MGKPHSNSPFQEKMHREMYEECCKKVKEQRRQASVEKLAERVLYDCTVNNIDPHQLLVALQNRMDLS